MMRIIVDPDMAGTVLDATEHTRETRRSAIDEIASRLEDRLAAMGLEHIEVEREYRTTGRRDDSGDGVLSTILDEVLIEQVDDIRSALGLGTVAS